MKAMDDSLDHLEIYAEFLGEEEFNSATENYKRTLTTMEELYGVELDRLKL
jgi:hypothetical protein